MAFVRSLSKAFHLLDKTKLLRKESPLCCRLLTNLYSSNGLGSLRCFAVSAASSSRLGIHSSVIHSHAYKVKSMLHALKGPLWFKDYIDLSKRVEDDLNRLSLYAYEDLHRELSAIPENEVVQFFIAALPSKSSSYTLLTAFEDILCQWDVTKRSESILCVLEYCLIDQTKYDCRKLRKHLLQSINRNFNSHANLSPSFISALCLVADSYDEYLTKGTLRNIENYVWEHIDYFTLEEIFPIMNMFTCRKYILPHGLLHCVGFAIEKPLRTKMDVGEEVIDTLIILILLQFYRKQCFSNNKLLDSIGDYITKPEHHHWLYNPFFVGKVVNCYASQKLLHEKLFQTVMDILTNNYKVLSLESFRLKDVAYLLWSYSFFGITNDSHPEFYKVLLRLLSSVPDNKKDNGYKMQISIVDILYSCSVAGVFPWDILRKDFTEEKILRTASSTVKETGYVPRVFQPLVINTCLEVEFPHYTGRLKQSTVDMFSESVADLAPEQELEKYCDILKDLHEVYGRDCVHSSNILPFCLLPFIQIWIDKRTNVPIKFTPEPYKKLIENVTLDRAKSSDVRKVLFSLVSLRQLVMNSTKLSKNRKHRLSGYQLLRKRLLTKLGFEVVFIRRDSKTLIEEIKHVVSGGIIEVEEPPILAEFEEKKREEKTHIVSDGKPASKQPSEQARFEKKERAEKNRIISGGKPALKQPSKQARFEEKEREEKNHIVSGGKPASKQPS